MTTKRRFRTSVKLTFVAVLVLFICSAAEATAYVVTVHRATVRFAVSRLGIRLISQAILNPYQNWDSQHLGNWVLKPGFTQTVEETAADKERTQRLLGAGLIREQAKLLGVSKTETVFRINSLGFKGPEIDSAHSKPRILALGDSCTFGTMLDHYSYPRAMERALESKGLRVEVINGGVEGYHPINVLYRIEELKRLRPEIVTIYIGWNALWGEEALADSSLAKLYSLRLALKLYEFGQQMVSDRTKLAMRLYQKPKKPDRNSAAVRGLEGFVPTFMPDVEQIVRDFKGAGSVVVLVTLPGLFSMKEDPTPEALKFGHLPDQTNNPYVLAKASEQYNRDLRELAGKYGLQVIDLESWADAHLAPRHAFFFDSVHLHEHGQTLIGEYMADELSRLVGRLQ